MPESPYLAWLAELAAWYERGTALPLGQLRIQPRPSPPPGAPKALLFSPHPDDEVIIGGLPLRLMTQTGAEVANVAVTQGSNPARQAARWEELQACCRHAGFRLIGIPDHGLERIRPSTRRDDPNHWSGAVESVASLLRSERPEWVFFPHDDDWNSTHIGTHWLVRDALERCGSSMACVTVETEFWGAMDDPNLMVESSAADVAHLISALTFHEGEVRRNPYHLRLAAWMMDNVRRGGELVGGQGGAPPAFLFATLYKVRRWQSGSWTPLWEGGKFLAANESPRAVLG